jgi:hypothetical protein
MKAYFEKIAKDSPVYICLVTDGARSSFYMENPKEENSSASGIVRVFISQEDLRNYSQMICANENVDEENVRKWEVKPTKVVEYFRELSDSYISSGKKPVRVVVCAVVGAEIVELDVLWTAESEKML